jgi:hypothetical protein
MKHFMRFVMLLSIFASMVVLFPDGTATAVWIVGPGGDFDQVQDAVDVAQNGDLILVHSGQYWPVTIDNLAVDIIADLNCAVTILGGVDVSNLSASQTVVIAGIDLFADPPFEGNAVNLVNNQGSLRLEHCALETTVVYHSHAAHGAYIDQCDDVAFTHCSVTGGKDEYWDFSAGHGVKANLSTIALYESDIQGCDGVNGGGYYGADGHDGGDGFNGTDVHLFASGCSFIGGDGGDGVDASANNEAGDGGDGGAGVHLQLGNPLSKYFSLDCQCLGGKGGEGGDGYIWPPYYPPGEDGDDGASIVAPYELNFDGIAHDFHLTTPVRENQLMQVSMEGDPGNYASIFLGFDTDTKLFYSFRGQFLLSVNPMPLLVYFGQLDTGGQLTASIPIPDLGPGFEFVKIYLQSYFWNSMGMKMLGAPQTLYLLDESY